MCPSVNPVSFRLGSNSTLLWGRQPTSFFFSSNVLKFNYVLLKFINYFFYKKNIQLVDFVINQAESRFNLFLVIYKVRLFARRYQLTNYKTFLMFRFKKDAQPIASRCLKKTSETTPSRYSYRDLRYFAAGTKVLKSRIFLRKACGNFSGPFSLNRFRLKSKQACKNQMRGLVTNRSLLTSAAAYRHFKLSGFVKDTFAYKSLMMNKKATLRLLLNKGIFNEKLSLPIFTKKAASYRKLPYAYGKKTKVRIKNTGLFFGLRFTQTPSFFEKIAINVASTWRAKVFLLKKIFFFYQNNFTCQRFSFLEKGGVPLPSPLRTSFKYQKKTNSGLSGYYNAIDPSFLIDPLSANYNRAFAIFLRKQSAASLLFDVSIPKIKPLVIVYNNFFILKTSFSFLKHKLFISKLLAWRSTTAEKETRPWRAGLLSRNFKRVSRFLQKKKKIKDFNFEVSVTKPSTFCSLEKITKRRYTFSKVERVASNRLQRMKELVVARFSGGGRLVSMKEYGNDPTTTMSASLDEGLYQSPTIGNYYDTLKSFFFFDILRSKTIEAPSAQPDTPVCAALQFNFFNQAVRLLLIGSLFRGQNFIRFSASERSPGINYQGRTASQVVFTKVLALRSLHNKVFLPGVSRRLNGYILSKKVGERLKKQKLFVINRLKSFDSTVFGSKPGLITGSSTTVGTALLNNKQPRLYSHNTKKYSFFKKLIKAKHLRDSTSRLNPRGASAFNFFFEKNFVSLRKKSSALPKKLSGSLSRLFFKKTGGHGVHKFLSILPFCLRAFRFWVKSRFNNFYFRRQKKKWPLVIVTRRQKRWLRKRNLRLLAARSKTFYYFLKHITGYVFHPRHVVGLKEKQSFLRFLKHVKSFGSKSSFLTNIPVGKQQYPTSVTSPVSAQYAVSKKVVVLGPPLKKINKLQKRIPRIYKLRNTQKNARTAGAHRLIRKFLYSKNLVIVPSAFRYFNSWVYKKKENFIKKYEYARGRNPHELLRANYPNIIKEISKFQQLEKRRPKSSTTSSFNSSPVSSKNPVWQFFTTPNIITDPRIKHKFKLFYKGSRQAKRYFLFSTAYKGARVVGACTSFSKTLLRGKCLKTWQHSYLAPKHILGSTAPRVRISGITAVTPSSDTRRSANEFNFSKPSPAIIRKLTFRAASRLTRKKIMKTRAKIDVGQYLVDSSWSTRYKRLYTVKSALRTARKNFLFSYSGNNNTGLRDFAVPLHGVFLFDKCSILLTPDFFLKTVVFLDVEESVGGLFSTLPASYLSMLPGLIVGFTSTSSRITRLNTRVVKKIRFFFKMRTNTGRKKLKNDFLNWKESSLTWFLKKQETLFLEFFFNHLFGVAFKITIFWAYNLLSYAEKLGAFLGKKSVFKQAHIPRRAQVFCRNFINLLRYGIKFCTLNGVSSYFAREFYSRARQRIFLITVEKILRYMNFISLNFSGLCMLVSGKLSRQPRAKKSFLMRGLRPALNRFDLKVNYIFRVVRCSFGSYGVKMWLYYV